LSEELKWVDAFASIAKSGSARCGDFGLDADGSWACIVSNIDKCAF
jgi:hypothetical protein